MEEEKESGALKFAKLSARKAARELYYPQSVINRIMNAQSTEQVNRILREARTGEPSAKITTGIREGVSAGNGGTLPFLIGKEINKK